MKKLPLTWVLMVVFLVSGKLTLLAQVIAAGSTVMIVQTPGDTPDVHYYIYANSDNGLADIPFPISAVGDKFDLWVKGTAWDEKVYLVDSKVVNAYSPYGEFKLTTGDAWTIGDPDTGYSIKRTRADIPYDIEMNAYGFKTEADAPDSAKSVRLDRKGLNYSKETYSALGAAEYWINSYALDNTTPTYQSSEFNKLIPEQLTKALGEEIWELHRLADVNPVDGTEVIGDTVINKIVVQIWPVADVTLEGIVDGSEVLDTIPPVSVQYKDLYPDSRTYARVYKGQPVMPPAVPPDAIKVPGSEVYYGAYYTEKVNVEKGITGIAYVEPPFDPANPDRFVMNLNAVCPTDGTYTLEVITETPFYGRATERLQYITFRVNRATYVRGTISTGN